MHRGHDCVVRLAVVGWRASENTLYTGDLCRNNAHMRGCDHWVAAARDVATYAVYGNVLVAKDYAWQSLFFNIS